MEQEIKMLEEIKAGLDERSKEYKSVVDAQGKLVKQAEDLSTAVTELQKKGATIEEMQGEIKELKAKTGRIKGQAQQVISVSQLISDTIAEQKANFAAVMDGSKFTPVKMETKAVGPILSTNLGGTTGNYLSYLDWRPGMEPIGQFHFRDMVRTIQSETDFVRFPRANTPIGEGSFGRTAEGSTKPQVDRDYTMIDLTLQTFAGYAIVSRQSLRNIVFLQSWLPTSMMDQLADQEDTTFANTLVSAATGSTTAPTGFTGAPELLIAYIANLIKAKYRPNGIAVASDVWQRLLVFQPGRSTTPVAGVPYSNPFVVTVDTNGTVRVLGIPVYPVNWLPPTRIIIGDWTKAAIVQSEGLTMRQSDSHAEIFTSNEIAFLLERTENLAIFRPDAFITTTIS